MNSSEKLEFESREKVIIESSTDSNNYSHDIKEHLIKNDIISSSLFDESIDLIPQEIYDLDLDIGFGPSYKGKLDGRILDQFDRHLNFSLHESHFVDIVQARISLQEQKKKSLHPGKDYRRTEEQVLDNRTKIILFKLLKQKIISEIDGCISTGKEANIYIGHKGSGSPEDWPEEFAVKIFKTCILKFKDRARYVTGEYRFRHSSTSKNSRKSVILWAEKEFRNLHRYYREGIPSPKPLLVKGNILLMELITQNSVPAPILKQADVSFEDLEKFYTQICYGMRRVYHKCLLVHSDLSEYNLLVRDHNIVFIDVGQAVETDNSNSNVFLRNDIVVITKFFKERGIRTAPLMSLFDFVVEQNLITDQEWVLNELRDIEETMGVEEFLGVYIPQNLDQVHDPEDELDAIEDGDYDTATLHGAYTGIVLTEIARENFDLVSDDDLEEDIPEKENKENNIPSLNRKECTKAEWKEKQQQMKDLKREKRKKKVSKVVKRKINKKSHPNAK